MIERTLRSARELADAGFLRSDDLAAVDATARRYAVAVSPAVTRIIDRSDPADPIARQFIPDRRELEVKSDELMDPIGDAPHSPVEGIVHRYPDRVLLKLAQVCAVYCRFCFRREMVGPSRPNALSSAGLERALDYIAAQSNLWEVILTGGDPLTVATRRLERVGLRLRAIPHVKVLRVHTRLPIAGPERIGAALIDALQASSKSVYVAVHANHPRELSPAALAACGRLRDAGCHLVSQTVLLRGVNDDAATLAALMRGFVEAGIRPYYLHHPDLAPGTSHFRLSIQEGQALVHELRGRISGLCQPHYVLDIPGGHGKSPIGPTYVRHVDGRTQVTDYRGHQHDYPGER